MSSNVAGFHAKRFSMKTLKMGTSLLALAAAGALLPSLASAQAPFGTMVGMQTGRTIGPNGQVSQWSGANRPVIGMEGDRHLMTIEQTQAKAVLDWEDFRLQTNEILEFQQASQDWIAVNRVHGNHAAEIHGEIRAPGSVYILNDNGVLIGEDAQINTRQLVVGSGVSDVNVDGNTTTIVQSQAKAELEWQKFEVATDQILEFEQASSDWLIINRDLSEPENVKNANQKREADVTIDGTIRANGIVVINDETGFRIGEDASIEAGRYFLTQGVADLDVTENEVIIEQSREAAVINWSDLNLDADEKLTIHQADESWMALNRDLSGDVLTLDGTIEADGGVLIIAREGIALNGTIEAQQVILSALDIRDDAFNGFLPGNFPQGLYSSTTSTSYQRVDPTFSNTWVYATSARPDADPKSRTDRYLNLIKELPAAHDENDPLRYNVTVGLDGHVSTREQGKIMLFGPNVLNQGQLSVRDEGQVILAAGDNIYIDSLDGIHLDVHTGAFNGFDARRGFAGSDTYAPYFMRFVWVSGLRRYVVQDSVIPEEWVDFVNIITGENFAAGDVLPQALAMKMIDNATFDGLYVEGGLIGKFINDRQAQRIAEVGFTARNEGIIDARRGGNVDFRGFNLEQNGAITLTSTANFRAGLSFQAVIQDYNVFGERDGPIVSGNGTVLFGEGSLTQITPDLEASDTLPLTEGSQSVGHMLINAQRAHLKEDALIYMPSGEVEIYLDNGIHVYAPIGASGNTDREDGSRFMMESGATIDLSGWDVTREMGYHQVSGRVFVAQLKDTPVQDGGPLYRKEINVDRRYGTNVVDWESFDNLNQVTLDQLLINGGTLLIASGDDLIMKSGSVIDVSGGSVTYEDGYVYTTMLRRLDGSVIDIREADPDEVYMGLADQWSDYDLKWGKQKDYYIPLISSSRGRFEESYVEGGDAGSVQIWAPDGLYQGTFLGGVTVGKYQNSNMPSAGRLIINRETEYDLEYISQRVLISDIEMLLGGSFGLYDSLTIPFGDLFGDEYDQENPNFGTGSDPKGNLSLFSEDFFNRSTMGEYEITQWWLGDTLEPTNDTPSSMDDYFITIEEGVDLNLAQGASFRIFGTSAMNMLGSITTGGGDVYLRGQGITFGDASFIDTSAKWYSDYELYEPRPLSQAPRIHGGDISITSFYAGWNDPEDQDNHFAFVMPKTMRLTANGGGWINREGELSAGQGGNIEIRNYMKLDQDVDLSALENVEAFGLGGNGGFRFETSGEIYIGNSSPDDAQERPILWMIRPEFFEEMGFSTVSLYAPSVTVEPGVDVFATQATMQINPATLDNGVPTAWAAPSGSDIRDVTMISYIDPGLRAEGLRDGVSLEFSTPGETQKISIYALLPWGFEGEGEDGAQAVSQTTLSSNSSIGVNAGGRINFFGDLRGTLNAPAGEIKIGGVIRSTAQVLAKGALRITERLIDNTGRELVDGEVLSGGRIYAWSDELVPLVIEEGAVFDVSGTQAEIDIPVLEHAGVVRRRRTLASDGGVMEFYGYAMDINNLTLRAFAGGDGAKGGQFTYQWLSTDYPALTSASGEAVANQLENNYFYYKSGYSNPETGGTTVRGLFGQDLSTIDFQRTQWNVGEFEPGTFLPDRESLVAVINSNNEAAENAPTPLFFIGDIELPDFEPATPPLVNPIFMRLYQKVGYKQVSLPQSQTQTVLSPAHLASGGFSDVTIAAATGIVFAGQSRLGDISENGQYAIDTLTLSAPILSALEDADFALYANRVLISDNGGTDGNYPTGGDVDPARFAAALAEIGVSDDNLGTQILIDAGIVLDITSANLSGFESASFSSGGDIRFTATNPYEQFETPTGSITTAGNLNFKADQIYAASGRVFTIEAGGTITVMPEDEGGYVNAAPLEGGAKLTLRAPRIVQGGIIRSPLGSIALEAFDDGTEDSNKITLLDGSVTSISADGNVIAFGRLVNGDTWVDPYTGRELAFLPEREVRLSADSVVLSEGALVDIKGGGDLLASEFVPGVGGSTDWLTGYRNENYDWISDESEVFAIIPGYNAEVTPLGTGNGYTATNLGKIYLSGNGELPEGEYTLLPAYYAQLPGAYRVTRNHQYGSYMNMALGTSARKPDGSVIHAGYRFTPNSDGSLYTRDQRTDGFLVMNMETLGKRSQYNRALASSFYSSDAYLRGAERTNLAITSAPRNPFDGGGLALLAGSELVLEGRVDARSGENGRGGYVDIAAERLVVLSENTDTSTYDGYLQLDAKNLEAFGAESLLLGGERQQVEAGTAIEVSGRDIVIDTAGETFAVTDLILTSIDQVQVKSGSKIETTGSLNRPAEAYFIKPAVGEFIDDQGTPWESDDVYTHQVMDHGAIVHVSAGERTAFIRDGQAVNRLYELANNPQRLAEINAIRVLRGLAPLDPAMGTITLEDNVSLISSQSLVLDATRDTSLASGVTLSADQITAGGSRVSIGEVPDGLSGLSFAGSTAESLSQAKDIALKSYTSIDLYGNFDLDVAGGLTLDAPSLRLLEGRASAQMGQGGDVITPMANAGQNVTLKAETLTLTNTSGGEIQNQGGEGELTLIGNTIELRGGHKAISGAGNVVFTTPGRLIGYDTGGLSVPGDLTFEVGALSVARGDKLAVKAGQSVSIESSDVVLDDDFETLGAILEIQGKSIQQNGHIDMRAGSVLLQARQGDVTLGEGALINASGLNSAIFDQNIGVNGGRVAFISDHGDVVLQAGSIVDVSGGEHADAGRLDVRVSQGEVVLDGELRGQAGEGRTDAGFGLRIGELNNFAQLNERLALGGFLGQRDFEIDHGDVILDGVTEVDGLSVIAHQGAITVTGTVRTTRDEGGVIALAAARDVTLSDTARLIAAANKPERSGGLVRIETNGENAGQIRMASGALIDVSGQGEGRRKVYFRAPQINGNDVAIGTLAGTIKGARQVLAEAFRIYTDVESIDQNVIDTVDDDARAFMAAAQANAVQDRLGAATLVPGIDLRNDGDIELVTDWDLHAMRYGPNQVAGVLSLRATGDILINANLSDGFDQAGRQGSLLDEAWNWAINLVAGANVESPHVLATANPSQLEVGKGSIIIGGEADRLDYASLNPDDYDLTQVTQGVSYTQSWNTLYSRLNRNYNRGFLSEASFVILTETNDRIENGELSYKDGYNYVFTHVAENDPSGFNTSNSYFNAIRNLTSWVDYDLRPRMSADNIAAYDAILADLTLSDQDRFIQLNTFFYEEYRDYFETDIVSWLRHLDAAPYYLRVNGYESKLFARYSDGSLGSELERDPATGFYLHPDTNAPITYAPGETEYRETEAYGLEALNWIVRHEPNQPHEYYRLQAQVNAPRGYVVRSGTGDINVAAAQNLILEQRPSVIYTSGRAGAAIDGYVQELEARYAEHGGDVNVQVGADVLASSDLPQTPRGWLVTRKPNNYEGFSPSWYVNLSNYEAGIGVLGGGHVTLQAGGDIHNLSVSSATNARLVGEGEDLSDYTLNTQGGGNVRVIAGGDIRGGSYTVMGGEGYVRAGGSLQSDNKLEAFHSMSRASDPQKPYSDCNIMSSWGCWDRNPSGALREFEVYSLFYQNGGNLHIETGGDLNVDAVMNPLYNMDAIFQYADDATELFSAGGDVKVWNNHFNIAAVEDLSFPASPFYFSYNNGINTPNTNGRHMLWPGHVSMIAAGGSVNVLGGMSIAPSAHGNVDILAQNNVQIGHHDRADDIIPRNSSDRAWFLNTFESNHRSNLLGLVMNEQKIGDRSAYFYAGYFVKTYGASGEFAPVHDPALMLDLHAGDLTPSRIYAAKGDVITTTEVTSPEALWVKAGHNVYFPNYVIQHNNPGDLSLIQAGNGIYFMEYVYPDQIGFGSQIHVAGEGRLEIETGRDFWIPSNSVGITSDRIYQKVERFNETTEVVWKPESIAADIAISVGYNQQPDYAAFDAAYLDPAFADAMADYLRVDAGDGRLLSAYLFDQMYARGNGASSKLVTADMAGDFVNYIRTLQGLEVLDDQTLIRNYLDTAWAYWLALPTTQQTPYDDLMPRSSTREAEGLKPEFFLPERRTGLINHVREMQGLEPLEGAEAQLAYLDEAMAYWQGLSTEYKAAFYRSTLFLELRTASREANDAKSDRFESVNRGYDAIATLYPGAQKGVDEALDDGESRWAGSFETYASRVMSFGGGDVDVVAPGGFFRLASIAATNEQTGQPSQNDINGDALRAGIITQDGGAVNILSHGSVDVNQSRILTTQGGNLLIWSSYGDIAAGNGAKTAIAPNEYEYGLDSLLNLNRSPAGLPSGAGIGTLASTPGTPPADVDLIASYGIVDAGDSGIRVSGNFNVYALEILGADNIDVVGRVTGLPEAPAVPPTSLDVGDLGSKSLGAGEALDDALRTVRDTSTIVTPSLIEVQVTGYGDEACDPDEDPNCHRERIQPRAGDEVSVSPEAQIAWEQEVMRFDVARQPLDHAVREISQSAGYNVLYDARVIAGDLASRPLQGEMTMQDALNLVLGHDLEAVLVEDRTVMIRPKS
ncbi:filamentous hemagglutinin N-terminal domain-containing protein [Woodsholea maritima]|uniref:filamentous hemagglutinin N-terminal domain-containing protein n=1 Tax=Woodsholea maritima TaxID=240237 RepID=UPI0003A388B8|nr:filamentous hemagglutinin N-terminal domain-containing protein [Woodsholea maritima]